MDENLVTVKDIIDHLKSVIKNKIPLDAQMYVEYATRLQLLVSDEQDKLFDLQQKVAQIRSLLITQGKSVAQAKVSAEASDDYKEMCKQKALVDNVHEMVRISKLQARMKQSEYNNW